MSKGIHTRFTTMPIIVVAICTTLWSCASGGGKQPTGEKQSIFVRPEVPVILQSPQERATYLVSHFWDNFNFADTTLIANAEITEQAFADYINLFPYVTMEAIEKSVSTILSKAITANMAMFYHFTELYEKYLYDPNSPFRQEEFYIAVLRSIIAEDKIDEANKTRPRYQLEMALKNRPGAIATDFAITQRNGRTVKLSAIAADYTILFFNNPDCHDCAQVKQMLSEISDPRVKIVAVYPDEEVELWYNTAYPASWINGRNNSIKEQQLYDLRATPTLYLLNKDKQVLLKDAPIEVVLDWLKNTN